MESDRSDDDGLDRSAYAMAARHFDAVQTVLPHEDVRSLAEEVVRRLAFRLPQAAKAQARPDDETIDRLVHALLSRDENAGERMIFAAMRDGVAPEDISLGYIAAAARRLGTIWLEDDASFVEVTLASSRLYRIIRGIRHVYDRTLPDPDRSRHVLLALVPDEDHSLGIEIAFDFLRREGWDVDLAVGESHDELAARMERVRFQSLVLVANSEIKLPALVRLVVAARILQPMASIIVAGKIVDQIADVDQVAGADAVITEMETAVSLIRSQMG